MSETPTENPNQITQPGAEETQAAQDTTQPQSQPAAQPTSVAGDEFPLRLVKVEDTSRHWNVAKGVWEQVLHAETGQPNYTYSLIGTIDGQDVELASWNGGRIDSRVQSQQRAQQQSGA